METTVSILAQYQEAAEAKLAQLAKRAAKYGQSITWTIGATTTNREDRVRWDGVRVKRLVTRVDFVVTGEAPRIGDFTLAAMLELFPTGVIVTGQADQEAGAIGHAWAGQCDHCGVNRQRRLGFVVQDADGTRKVVGKSCLKDHLGADVPAGALQVFTHMAELGAMDEESLGFGGFGGWEHDTLGTIAAARAAIALWGWRAAGIYREESTAARVSSLHDKQPRGQRAAWAKELRTELEARGDHYEEAAQAVIDWATGLEPTNDYQNNLKVALGLGYVPSKLHGLVVSAAGAFDFAERGRGAAESARLVREEAARQAAQAAQEAPERKLVHLGHVGERLAAELVLERAIGLEANDWGEPTLYILRDAAGNRLSWITNGTLRSGKPGRPLEAGDKFKAKFSVKAHRDFKGVPETRVTRLAVQ